MPYADVGAVKIPDGLTDEQVLFLATSCRPAGRRPCKCDIQPTDTVAIWGCGPVGQMAIRSAMLLGAKQVVAIDHVPERLAMARAGGAITIDFEEGERRSSAERADRGKGPEKCIDAVGHGGARRH